MDIKALEQEVQDRLASIEEAKQRDAAEFEQRKKERAAALEVAKDAQRKEIEAKAKARIDREARQQAAYAEWEKQERERRQAEERENLKAEAAKQEEAEKLKALQDQLAQLEFAEEQRRRAMEEALPPVVTQDEIVDGIHGLTPVTSEMSDHLKLLLRQDRDFTNE